MTTAALLDLDAGQGILLAIQQDGLGVVALYGAGCSMTWNGSLPPED